MKVACGWFPSVSNPLSDGYHRALAVYFFRTMLAVEPTLRSVSPVMIIAL